MALFQKKPQTSNSAPLYTLGLNKTYAIIGLGNPGKEYDLTRHNLGFMAVDDFAAANDFPAWIEKKDLKCLMTQHNLGQNRVILIKPTTFMNLSGEAVQAVLHFYKVPLDQLLVVHDELDVDFGQVRCRVGGASAGHNGIKSLIDQLGEDFGRIRIGIGPKQPENIDSADFVLAKLTKDEQAQLQRLTKEVGSVLTEWIYSGNLSHDTRNFLV